MENSSQHFFDVIIIGGGHAGLSMSHVLTQRGIKHMVFERGKIGETWRSQRWDSFALNTPGHMNSLPGEECDESAEGFLLRDKVVSKLNNYAQKFQLPVQQNATVISVTKKERNEYFKLIVQRNQESIEYTSRQLVVASGAMNLAKIPTFGKKLSANITQLHVLNYRNAAHLPQGAVLVVGSGQSGGQIAEDLVAAGRKVYLATSRVGRVPRSYRGLDILDWLCKKIPFYHALKTEITDPSILMAATPLVSGTGSLGHTLSLQSLHRQGVTILGKLINIEDVQLFFASDVAENVRYGDEFSHNIKQMVEDFIATENFIAQPIEIDEADMPDVDASCVDDTLSLNCIDKNITNIIWATGFAADFSWIKLPVFNDRGQLVHDNGISPVQGLYFLGFPWLRSRKSGIIYGMTDDTNYLANEILKAANKL